MTIPERQIRAVYDDKTIRVYQAYNNSIAESAVRKGTFVSPPFKMARMTWIKPSFLWMMYRSGWGKKDSRQNHILAIDISREGFEWALENSLLSHDSSKYADKREWLEIKKATPVRIQWDPERDFHFTPLAHRAIQVGLTGKAVELYVNDWIQNITDVTELAHQIHGLVSQGKEEAAIELLPIELPYSVNQKLQVILGM